jgi:chitinase
MMKMLFKKKRYLITVLVFLMIFSNSFATTVFAARKDRYAPSAPQNLRAASVSASAVSLAWNASIDNVGVKSYDIYMNSAVVGNTASTAYTVSGLKSSATYQFYVKAKDAAGNVSQPSNYLSVTTLTSPTPTPTLAPTAAPTPTTTPTPTPT